MDTQKIAARLAAQLIEAGGGEDMDVGRKAFLKVADRPEAMYYVIMGIIDQANFWSRDSEDGDKWKAVVKALLKSTKALQGVGR